MIRSYNNVRLPLDFLPGPLQSESLKTISSNHMTQEFWLVLFSVQDTVSILRQQNKKTSSACPIQKDCKLLTNLTLVFSILWLV